MFFIEPFIFSLRMPVSKLQKELEELVAQFNRAILEENHNAAVDAQTKISIIVRENRLKPP